MGFIERHSEKIAGVLSCLDRVVITGTLPDNCHAEAATRYLFNHEIRIFRLHPIRRAAPRSDPQPCRGTGVGSRLDHRIPSRPQPPQGGSDPGDPRPTRPSSWAGPYLLG